MHSLNLKRINEKAPYLVTLNENDETYTFVTESGVEYSIGFMPDDLLQSDESYEFVIANLNDKKSPRDKKVKDTVVTIVEEFFNSNSLQYCISVLQVMVNNSLEADCSRIGLIHTNTAIALRWSHQLWSMNTVSTILLL